MTEQIVLLTFPRYIIQRRMGGRREGRTGIETGRLTRELGPVQMWTCHSERKENKTLNHTFNVFYKVLAESVG